MTQGLLQERERSENVGLDELSRRIDRAINMRFGGEMEHRIRMRLLEDGLQCNSVADVRVAENMLGVVTCGSEGFQVSGIGQRVDIDDAMRRLGDKLPDER
jgi:hypothetical protein